MPLDPLALRATTASHVAHGACPAGRGRLLRVALVADTDRRPTIAQITDCPVCGGEHTVSLLWRRIEDRDEGKTPDLVVDAEGRQA